MKRIIQLVQGDGSPESWIAGLFIKIGVGLGVVYVLSQWVLPLF